MLDAGYRCRTNLSQKGNKQTKLLLQKKIHNYERKEKSFQPKQSPKIISKLNPRYKSKAKTDLIRNRKNKFITVNHSKQKLNTIYMERAIQVNKQSLDK